MKAWRFSSATDRDGNGLIENTKVGHGWTEGSPPYPPHEEIYLQGVWIEASRRLAEMADAKGDAALAAAARAAAEKCRQAVEKTYWLKDAGYYAFATALAKPEKEYNAEPGPRRAARQARIEALRGKLLVDEDTVLPGGAAVVADARRGARAVPDRPPRERRRWPPTGAIGSSPTAASCTTRSRTTSARSGACSPAGRRWARIATGVRTRATRRVMANVLLTYQYALGYVTELLSGDFNAPFGRSSHHQVWSEAMVVTPLVRGLLGHRGHGGRPDAHVRAAASRGLGPRVRDQRARGRGALRPRPRAARRGGRR